MKGPQYIIRYAGKYPVRIVKNLCGQVFELVSEDRASRFDSQSDANQAAINSGVRNFTVEPEHSLAAK